MGEKNTAQLTRVHCLFLLFNGVECINKELHPLLHMERCSWVHDTLMGFETRKGFYLWSQKYKNPHKSQLAPQITRALKQLPKDSSGRVLEQGKMHTILCKYECTDCNTSSNLVHDLCHGILFHGQIFAATLNYQQSQKILLQKSAKRQKETTKRRKTKGERKTNTVRQ